MINVLAIKENADIADFCSKNGIEVVEGRGVTVARDGDEILGYCAYILRNDDITITHLSPEDDIMLADGILRSALHIADFRGIESAFYAESTPVMLFDKLKFIKDPDKMTLKIEKLHESCCSCGF